MRTITDYNIIPLKSDIHTLTQAVHDLQTALKEIGKELAVHKEKIKAMEANYFHVWNKDDVDGLGN